MIKKEFENIDDLIIYHNLWTDFLNGFQILISGFSYFDKLVSLIKKVPEDRDSIDILDDSESVSSGITNWLNIEEVV